MLSFPELALLLFVYCLVLSAYDEVVHQEPLDAVLCLLFMFNEAIRLVDTVPKKEYERTNLIDSHTRLRKSQIEDFVRHHKYLKYCSRHTA